MQSFLEKHKIEKKSRKIALNEQSIYTQKTNWVLFIAIQKSLRTRISQCST
jgi:hypothetical protein